MVLGYTHTHTPTYIYIWREREREGSRFIESWLGRMGKLATNPALGKQPPAVYHDSFGFED